MYIFAKKDLKVISLDLGISMGNGIIEPDAEIFNPGLTKFLNIYSRMYKHIFYNWTTNIHKILLSNGVIFFYIF